MLLWYLSASVLHPASIKITLISWNKLNSHKVPPISLKPTLQVDVFSLSFSSGLLSLVGCPLFKIPQADRISILLERRHVGWVLQSCSALCNPMDCSPPGSSVHGILQARNGLPFHSPADLPDPRIESASLLSSALVGRFFTTSTT